MRLGCSPLASERNVYKQQRPMELLNDPAAYRVLSQNLWYDAARTIIEGYKWVRVGRHYEVPNVTDTQ
jgi:hypothetical protein